MRRRPLLVTAVLAVTAAACGASQTREAPVRPEQPTPQTVPDFEPWTREAHAILSDGLHSLGTFDDFIAFRASTTAGSELRRPAELVWDPPTGDAWAEATHVAAGLHGRAEQLFNVISTARLDEQLWRQQRELADDAHALMDLGDALQAYSQRVQSLPPGDASGTLSLLDQAWDRWDAAAASWGLSRAETLSCS
jgi:hypothetical protein